MNFIGFILIETLGRYLVWRDKRTIERNRNRAMWRRKMYGKDGLIMDLTSSKPPEDKFWYGL
jgi:hypothetical protein